MKYEAIPDFPAYMVSDEGTVMNKYTERVLALTVNRSNVVQVGLMRDGKQHKRGVALLVARAFLDPPVPETFDTPIHLDGDYLNNHVDNLMWRPRWFAIKYQMQHNTYSGFPANPHKLIEINTKMKFKNSWEATTRFGLLEMDLIMSMSNRTYVWPTYQQFRVLNGD